ncbi:MAG: peptidase [Alphaproteobacteria bacterium]|nr:peptidase [Alphaproteobacteria bacterium]
MFEQILHDIFPLHLNYPIIFGMFMVCGVLGGLMAHKISWLPTITGFMVVGLAMGPEGAGVISGDIITQAGQLVQITLGLILYKLGSTIHPKEILKNPQILLISLIESAATFFAILAILLLFKFSLIISVLVAAIGISSSPAVLVHVANEMRAKGPVTENAKLFVALNNMLSFLVFTMALPFALYTKDAPIGDIVGIPFYRLFGGFVVGLACAALVTGLARLLTVKTFHYAFPLILGGIMLTLGLNTAFQVSFLFSCLVFGVMVRWLESPAQRLTTMDFGYAEDIFFIILFVTAGASLHLQELWHMGFVALAFPLGRCLAKYGTLFAAKKALGYTRAQASATGMLLMPMAGMAIGLLQTANSLVPSVGAQLAVLVFSAVAVLETIGPPIAKYAFKLCEEGRDDEGENVHGAN